jgi:hypothetical protein
MLNRSFLFIEQLKKSNFILRNGFFVCIMALSLLAKAGLIFLPSSKTISLQLSP